MIRTGCVAALCGALLVGLVAPSAASAQTSSCSTGNGNGAQCGTPAQQQPSVTIPKLAELVVNSASTFSLAPTGGTITAANFVTGNYDVASTITVTARANATWSATIRATNANFNAPCATKTAGDLRWGRSTGTRTTPMATTAAQIFTSSTNAATAAATQQLFFNVALGWTTDPPGTCSLPLTFSISAP